MSRDFCCQEMADNVLLISRYAERLTWSVCFTTDRVDPEIFNMVFERNTTANSHVVSCDTLTFLRDPTKRASFLPLFSFGLLPVIHLPTESTHWDVHVYEVDCCPLTFPAIIRTRAVKRRNKVPETQTVQSCCLFSVFLRRQWLFRASCNIKSNVLWSLRQTVATSIN